MSALVWLFEEYLRAPESARSPRSIVIGFLRDVEQEDEDAQVLVYPRLKDHSLPFERIGDAARYIDEEQLYYRDAGIIVATSALNALARVKQEYDRSEVDALSGWDDKRVFPFPLSELNVLASRLLPDTSLRRRVLIIFYGDAEPMMILRRDG